MDLKSYPYLGLPVQTCRCLRKSTSPAVNTKAIFWTSSWPFHRNQHIIPFLCTVAKAVAEAVNQMAGITKLLYEGQVTASPSTLGACSWLSWAALPRWHLSCKPKHAAEGCPQDSECACVPACPSVHHHSKSQRLLHCKFMCPHKAAREFLLVDVQKPLRVHIRQPGSEILQQKSLARHVESFRGRHISA